jgi:two-component system, response regulator AauR
MIERNSGESANAAVAGGTTGSRNASQPSSQLVILAIHDDPEILKFYKLALAKEGVRVEGSADPHHGLELAGALNPGLVLLDLTMPGIDGLEVLQRIRERDPLTRVVMVTGNYSIETAVKAIQEGAADYVCKPVRVEKLRALIEEARKPANHHGVSQRRAYTVGRLNQGTYRYRHPRKE